LASGVVTRRLLQTGWRRIKGGDPPTNPASPSTTWSEALIWAASSGVAIAVARLVAARGAAEAWKAATGSYPEGLEDVSP
jgi:NADPH:quinone reductase-like Zn-dependent oxidoreductase